MSNALQNRLVGTIILVAVIVIFLPDYLDGKKETNTETFVDFPRSTTNLSATEPDAFPAEKVAEATRRNVVVVNETAVDAEYEEQNAKSNKNTDASQVVEQNNATESTESQASADKQAAMTEQLAKNMKAASSQNQAADEGETSETPTSLETQTLVQSDPESVLKDTGWVVQLGSFGNQKNVNELLKKLDKAGYRAFSRKVRTSGGELTKVFVGPELVRENLDNALPHLKQTTGLSGKVTTFDIATN
ncbi:SPOR domain-containing protein [Glaciecola sp. MH2013]|uniref:SPOR domain-containing protein n=1 Tax=Glaciecola sp. MH2013 TaxID=2785524 RepID=UPI00189C9525|nr:SPOR domain-containing protein [Glaciecola sp. MH2013]MBF7073121.1 SPOR domain-containing protein [Glaciecola sp. MH2013]